MSRKITFILALLIFALAAESALAASRVSGRISNTSFDLVLLARDGRAHEAQPNANGRFKTRVPSSRGMTLQLLHDGQYAGPVVLRGKKPRVALAKARRVNLGKVRVREGYATTSRRVEATGKPIKVDSEGRPLGAGKLGLVGAQGSTAGGERSLRGASARAGEGDGGVTEGADVDRDGVPGAFDADDDGDLTLDNIEGTESTGAQLSLSSALPLDITDTINANAGADPDREAIIREGLRLLFIAHADELGGAQSVGVECVFSWCSSADVVNPNGVGNSSTPWADANGDGLLDLEPFEFGFQRQIFPRAASAEIVPGDTFTATSNQDDSAVAALAFYFQSSVAIKAIGPHTLSYPAEPGSPGAPGNPITVPSQAQITLWRPQRAAIPGAESGAQMDIGGLRYGVDVNGAFCRPEDFSGLSPTVQPAPGDEEAPLVDSAPDAPPSGDTLSFTVDLAACGARGGDTGGGFPMVSVVAKDASQDLTRQHLVVQFE